MLCAISLFDGYLGTLITQTMTYVADGFGVEGDRAQGVTLAAVRLAIFLALPLVALADRRGRRNLLLLTVTAGVLLAAVTALHAVASRGSPSRRRSPAASRRPSACSSS